ncbi:MAG: preprotein translocase subunit YajC [Candidatus Dadabacteria bacterium]|nr:preprotein translocase subunit YajC [Candidatus Dadabacteria bacterium]
MSAYVISIIFLLVLLTAGCVPSQGTEGQGGSKLITFAPFILIFALFYFLILRPQQKQQKHRKDMLVSLKRGDKVLTAGGIYGKVVNIDGDELTVEIAKGINVRMSRSGVSGVEEIKGEKKS